jgi:hypothetical protein
MPEHFHAGQFLRKPSNAFVSVQLISPCTECMRCSCFGKNHIFAESERQLDGGLCNWENCKKTKCKMLLKINEVLTIRQQAFSTPLVRSDSSIN